MSFFALPLFKISLYKVAKVYSLDIHYPIFYNPVKAYFPMDSEDFAKILWKI